MAVATGRRIARADRPATQLPLPLSAAAARPRLASTSSTCAVLSGSSAPRARATTRCLARNRSSRSSRWRPCELEHARPGRRPDPCGDDLAAGRVAAAPAADAVPGSRPTRPPRRRACRPYLGPRPAPRPAAGSPCAGCSGISSSWPPARSARRCLPTTKTVQSPVSGSSQIALAGTRVALVARAP